MNWVRLVCMPNLSGTYLNLDFELFKLQKIELLIHILNVIIFKARPCTFPENCIRAFSLAHESIWVSEQAIPKLFHDGNFLLILEKRPAGSSLFEVTVHSWFWCWTFPVYNSWYWVLLLKSSMLKVGLRCIFFILVICTLFWLALKLLLWLKLAIGKYSSSNTLQAHIT